MDFRGLKAVLSVCVRRERLCVGCDCCALNWRAACTVRMGTGEAVYVRRRRFWARSAPRGIAGLALADA